MNQEAVIALIQEWKDLALGYQESARQIHALMGGWVDSPIDLMFDRMLKAYERLLSERSGIRVDSLEWFRFECAFGANALECSFEGDVMLIDSIEAFVKFELSGGCEGCPSCRKERA